MAIAGTSIFDISGKLKDLVYYLLFPMRVRPRKGVLRQKKWPAIRTITGHGSG